MSPRRKREEKPAQHGGNEASIEARAEPAAASISVSKADQGSRPGFSLIVTADANAWETDGLLRFPKERLGEYSDSSGAGIRLEDPASLKLLEGTEALLVYEGGGDSGLVRLGTLHDLGVGRNQIEFHFELIGTLAYDVLVEFASRLGIDRFEFSRTHWAVKNGELPSGIRDRLTYPGGPAQRAAVVRAIKALVDGNEEQRWEVLRQIQTDHLDRIELAHRLREEIQHRFGWDAEADFVRSERDPKKFSSIRSWMLSCLVWADAEGPDSREVILAHVTKPGDPDRHVRFWTLAALFHVSASYLEETATASTRGKMPEVRLLAQLILYNHAKASRTSPAVALRATRARFTRLLTSADFEREVWPALRALRACPAPEFAEQVCRILLSTDDSVAQYDALYALTPRPMAEAASEILLKELGLERIVELVLRLAENANDLALRNLTEVLRPFDIAEVKAAALAARLDRFVPFGEMIRLLEQSAPGVVTAAYVAGYASDEIDPSIDDLGIRRDAHTLAAVMLAREVKPPLAIGLFGDWGSGKSHFMQAIELATEEVRGRSDRFCSEVVAVRFNAWHYADQNLWASLVSSLLEELRTKVVGRREDERARADALEIAGLRDVIEEANKEVEQVREDAEQKAADLREKEEARRRAQLRLRDLAGNLAELFPEGSEEREALGAALERVGASGAVQTVRDLEEVVHDVHSVTGRAAATVSEIVHGRHGRAFWCWILLAFLGVPVTMLAAIWLEWLDAFLTDATIVVGEVITLGAAVVTALRGATSRMQQGLKAVDQAKARFDKKLAERRALQSPEEKKLREELAALTAREDEARARLEAASNRIAELEARRREVEEERSLARFLIERSDSDDYRRHLGLVSTIRADLEALAKRLDRGIGLDKKRVERIVLYIDDLDRCSSKQVRAVLEAVHLLLAYPLFVVVVGVDPRWLQYALQEEFPAFDTDGTDPNRPTPQNYLEKIFQIPYSLRPMSEVGFEKLVTRLLGTVEPVVFTGAEGGERGVPSGHAGGEEDTNLDPPSRDETGGADATDGADAEDGKGDEPAEFRVHDEAMVIQPWEAAFASRFHGIVPTPRSLKRFTNLYRILKAPIPRGDLLGFEGTEQLPGEFQVPMLLLALQACVPNKHLLLDLFHVAKDGGDVLANLLAALEADQRHAFLAERIRVVARDTTHLNDPAPYLKWIPRVARFSFDLGSSVSFLRPD